MDKPDYEIVSVELFYRCPECGATHEIIHTHPDDGGKWLGVIAYVCDVCGYGVGVLQTRIRGVEVADGKTNKI